MTTQPQYVTYPGSTAIAADLTALATNDIPGLPNGFQVYVVAEKEIYRLDTANPLTASSPLIVARGATAGAGAWYRRSRAYVVSNFTLWVACGNASARYIAGYTPGQLTATATVTPDILIQNSNNTGSSVAVVTDMLGNLWWSRTRSASNNLLLKIALKDTLQTGTPAEQVALNLGNTGSSWLAFDKDNNLWSVIGSAAFQKYTPEQYSVSGTPTPTISIQARGVAGGQLYILFDDRNNLWSVSFSSPSMSMMSAGQLLFSSTLTQNPAFVWSGSNFVGCSGFAFGPTGLVWLTNYVGGAGSLKAFDPRSPSSGNPAPSITLTSASFVGLTDVSFDSSGNLWAMNFDNTKILRIPAASLGASGAVTPDIIITPSTPTGALTSAFSLNFAQQPNRSGLIPSGAPIVASY